MQEASIESVRTYWQTAPPYLHLDKTYYDIATHIRAWGDAKSVFEFGCNSGLCLKLLKEQMPYMQLFGIDLNEAAIKYGKLNFGLDLVCADHNYLQSMNNKSYDICLTRSVLCHIPESYINGICEHLKRISRQFVLIVEPPALDNRSTGHTWIYDYMQYGFKEVKTRLTDKGDPYTFWVCHTNL